MRKRFLGYVIVAAFLLAAPALHYAMAGDGTVSKKKAKKKKPQPVMLCHLGHDIVVSSRAVPAHLAHGDLLGSCSGQED